MTSIDAATKPGLVSALAIPAGFVAGIWREPAHGRVFEVVDPATERVVAAAPDCSVADARLALTAAHEAGETWARFPLRARAGILHRLFELVHEHRERLAVTISLEVGKTLAEARGEVDYAADYIRWYAEEAVRPAGRSTPSPDGRSHIVTVAGPLGPCLLITPWNVPLAMATRKLAPALAAGCTAILKPSELTPLSSLILAELALEAGLPPGVLSVLPTTEAATVCADLMADDRLRKVSFTGSTAVGRILLEQGGRRVLRMSMELGGNAPFLVFDDADLDTAVEEAMTAKMRMGGQSCVAANRFLVQDSIADQFADALAARVNAMRVGPPGAEGVDLGPLVSALAVAKARRLVEDALARGASLRAQATIPDGRGFYYPPTVLDNVDRGARICREEVFGPVAAISRFSTEDEALALANDTEFGLAAYLVTRDLGRASRVAGRLQAGMVGINRGLVSNVAAPFGGIKQSGLGREGGAEGLLEYQQTKYLAVPPLYS
ncbi:NAD-dependent succinate-semialdehyde dehydrogenase [Rhodococcus jostii]|uniref:Succinate-semialdehyde dehydrogenase / glutarate-semialdehyde dehydrogenase n=1 Tax=Rhodococcus jostii TaxID=132919 RepID=A0A1H4ISR8_RHOJO|nr:NAD-dependent succinate-semialdehyde dehydrogenase [Rhodococcus jostii]SEB36252.1 succinate-semialdehyde dehydrogenase / glutarate-semialdehyde dehydrogenase [Rhodococcus jostii]